MVSWTTIGPPTTASAAVVVVIHGEVHQLDEGAANVQGNVADIVALVGQHDAGRVLSPLAAICKHTASVSEHWGILSAQVRSTLPRVCLFTGQQ